MGTFKKKVVPENYFVWKYLSITLLFGGSFQYIILIRANWAFFKNIFKID